MTAPALGGGWYVYRLYDGFDRLLYVGCSINPKARFSEHKSTQFWWPLVARMRFAGPYTTKAEGHAAERTAMREEAPRHNLCGNPHRIRYDAGEWAAWEMFFRRTGIDMAAELERRGQQIYRDFLARKVAERTAA